MVSSLYLHYIPGGKVHQPKPQPSQQSHTDVENYNGGFHDQVDVDGGHEQPGGGDGHTQHRDQPVAVLGGEGRHQGAAGEDQEDHDGAGQGRLPPPHVEVLADPREQQPEGVSEAVLEEGDEERGCHNSPGQAASVRPLLVFPVVIVRSLLDRSDGQTEEENTKNFSPSRSHSSLSKCLDNFN